MWLRFGCWSGNPAGFSQLFLSSRAHNWMNCLHSFYLHVMMENIAPGVAFKIRHFIIHVAERHIAADSKKEKDFRPTLSSPRALTVVSLSLRLSLSLSLCLSLDCRLNVFAFSLDTMSTISPTDFDSLEIQQQYNDINNRWDLAAEQDWDNENSSARLFERSRIKALAGTQVSRTPCCDARACYLHSLLIMQYSWRTNDQRQIVNCGEWAPQSWENVDGTTASTRWC